MRRLRAAHPMHMSPAMSLATRLLLPAALGGLALSAFLGHALASPHGSGAPAAALVGGAAGPGCQDDDHDGYGVGCAKGPDCNDHDATMHPGAAESCNFRDDDCNGRVDDAPTCVVPPHDASRVTVPAGRFRMGSDGGAADERPVHAVSGPAFQIDRYEVTNARYAACLKAGKCAPPSLSGSNQRAHYFDDPGFADYPVIFVSWDQASAFCAFEGGRLPSEAEWERAARGTDSPRTFPWGDSPADCSKANMAGCGGDTDLVGRREAGASPYGAMDMAGNVWEWTRDWYDAGYYAHAPASDPRGPERGTLKVMRGGCWASGESSLRTTCRKAELPATWAPNVGLRCVYPLDAIGGGS
jgi:formylglycine-generating enzyme required for sulfatase activity